MTEFNKKKYLSCKWLESGVCFDNGDNGSNIKLCCYLSCPGGGNSFIYKDYNGEKINWEDFFKIKNQYRDVQRNGGIVPECSGCVFLEEKEWCQDDYIDNIIFDHFTKCNCNCSYCYTNKDKKKYNTLKSYNIYPIIKDMFDKKIIRRGGAIGFGGGEPTMLPEFDKLLDLFIENGFTDIRVPSSGIKYSKVIEKGISRGQVSVNISIDSSSRETYKEIKRIDAFEAVCKNLKRYSNAQTSSYNVISKYILIPDINDNETEIVNWLNFNKENKIGIVVIDIENSVLTDFRKNEISQNIINMFNFAVKKAQEMNFYKIEICDRARQMLKEQ